MRRWVVRWVVRWIVPVAVGLGLAGVVGLATRPWRFVEGRGLIALVSDSCAYSHDVLHSVLAFEEVRAHVTPVPIDFDPEGRDPEFWQAACAVAVERVRIEAPWLWAAPERWLCEQLAIDAAKVHARRFVGVPAYMLDGEAVARDELDGVLATYGLGRRGGVIVPLDRVAERAAEEPTREGSATVGVRGSGVGL
ncbi:hypothetical protein [Paraliomyxa miuraensis]|uniref:hypothetical protein n=1 Tax=Paraliomyxa miuraensis TaxID=376150 RepID=UPI002256E5FD|nr:hypothetical protein [Paraliomyxa miuraensis]MCX4243705.1 hypothetical protein [Paraliomyxa miuraensis]